MSATNSDPHNSGSHHSGVPQPDVPTDSGLASTSDPAAPGAGETQHIVRNDPMSAVIRLRERIESGRGDYRTWHNLAVAQANSGARQEAMESVQRALDASQDSAATHFLHAVLLRDQDLYTESLDAFQRVAELDPEFRRLHANRGVVRFFLEDNDGALADLETAWAKDPSDPMVLFNLAVVSVTLKRFSAARRHFEMLIELERDRASFYHQFLVELGRLQVIEETLTQAHRIKNFMGIVGDRLRTFCDRELESLAPEAGEDLQGIRDDYERVYSDLVVFLRAIQPRPLRLEETQLRRILDCILFVSADHAQGIRVQREIPDSLSPAVCDIEMVQEAFLNLVLNAFDAIRQRHGESGGELMIRARPLGGAIEVSFTDNGTGIPEGELNRVFNFGFTTKSLGTGIGLSFTRKVLEDHGGSVSVESLEGQGTTFVCVLPLEPRISESLANMALRSRLFHDPRELILEESEEDLGI